MFSFFKRFGRSQDSKDNAEQKRDDTPPLAPTQPAPAVPDAQRSPSAHDRPPVAPSPAQQAPAIGPAQPHDSTSIAPAGAPSTAPITQPTQVADAASTVTPPAAPVPFGAPAPVAEPAPAAPSTPATSSSSIASRPPAAPTPIGGSAVAPTDGMAAPAATRARAPAPAADAFEIVPPPVPEPAAKQSWMRRLRGGLSRTSSNLTTLFVGVKVDEALFEELEDALLLSDAGVEATQFLINGLRQKVRNDRLTDGTQVKAALRDLLVDLLKPLERTITLGREQPMVMMIAGVNGAGKTTSIGKLAKHLQHYGQSVLLAAGDTFRAAAREQLVVWGQRNNVTVIEQAAGDPAAVIFDAVNAARARKIDIVMADTAGRLPTQLHLMDELRKIKRVTAKAMDGAPHEVLLVLDANTGQNGLAQVKAFDDALGLTGLIVTKLDGTAKGGILAAIARQRPVPVYFIGVGESVDDLQPFSAVEFADALLG
ncbi:signal recognition particle-docking protein FtsY [Robbsia andropogonis]|uniref:signal recognition particle-docking protein FtsY n=1 Tax=Robbsia andropogonis TaxID=28092 RepID=UPI0004640F9F|nr:signal recognition particle-docking protein FtsY [Robbsia andropogonis]